MTQAMCRGCFQTKECEEYGEYGEAKIMLCKKCWSKGATIAQKAKVER